MDRKALRKSFENFGYVLYSALLSRLAITTVYQTFRVSILGQLTDANQINIASQMNWVSVLLKITDERYYNYMSIVFEVANYRYWYQFVQDYALINLQPVVAPILLFRRFDWRCMGNEKSDQDRICCCGRLLLNLQRGNLRTCLASYSSYGTEPDTVPRNSWLHQTGADCHRF